jgi:hypothetical protein
MARRYCKWARIKGELMTTADSSLPRNQVADLRSTPDKKLIRAGLLMLLFMTTAFGAETWNTMRDLATPIRTLPVMLFVIVCITVARLYAKVDEIAAVQHTASCAIEPVPVPNLGPPAHSVKPLHMTGPRNR